MIAPEKILLICRRVNNAADQERAGLSRYKNSATREVHILESSLKFVYREGKWLQKLTTGETYEGVPGTHRRFERLLMHVLRIAARTDFDPFYVQRFLLSGWSTYLSNSRLISKTHRMTLRNQYLKESASDFCRQSDKALRALGLSVDRDRNRLVYLVSELQRMLAALRRMAYWLNYSLEQFEEYLRTIERKLPHRGRRPL